MVTLQVLRTGYPMEVHSVNCNCKAMKQHSTDWKISGETVKEAVQREATSLNSDFESNYSVSELFRVMPCCK